MTENHIVQGWATLEDGSRVQLSQEECEALIANVEANEARKAEMMPTSREAVRLMFDAYDRLKKLGWRQGCYCPKDGTEFAVIEHGSTGIFTGRYSGEWPKGYVHVEDEVCRPNGILWKPIDKLTEWEEEMRQKSSQSTAGHMARLRTMASKLRIAKDDSA